MTQAFIVLVAVQCLTLGEAFAAWQHATYVDPLTDERTHYAASQTVTRNLFAKYRLGLAYTPDFRGVCRASLMIDGGDTFATPKRISIRVDKHKVRHFDENIYIRKLGTEMAFVPLNMDSSGATDNQLLDQLRAGSLARVRIDTGFSEFDIVFSLTGSTSALLGVANRCHTDNRTIGISANGFGTDVPPISVAITENEKAIVEFLLNAFQAAWTTENLSNASHALPRIVYFENTNDNCKAGTTLLGSQYCVEDGRLYLDIAALRSLSVPEHSPITEWQYPIAHVVAKYFMAESGELGEVLAVRDAKRWESTQRKIDKRIEARGECIAGLLLGHFHTTNDEAHYTGMNQSLNAHEALLARARLNALDVAPTNVARIPASTMSRTSSHFILGYSTQWENTAQSCAKLWLDHLSSASIGL